MFRPLALVISATVTLASCSGASASSESVPPVAATAASSAATTGTFTGTVVESMDSGGYTYMRLQDDAEDVWIAVTAVSVTTGERITAPLEMPMQNFRSNTLDRDFPLIYFVTQVARDGQPLQSSPVVAVPAAGAGTGLASMPVASHGTDAVAPQSGAPATVAPNAPPTGGHSVADIWAKRVSLADTVVTVRGTVVKVNDAIMGFNWIHVQDGSGEASLGTNDLTITTAASLKVGDVVTMSGTLSVNKDFGAGYVFDAIVENATVLVK